MITLRKIGYFDSPLHMEKLRALGSSMVYPKEQVVAYLRGGMEIFSWLEYTRCSYGCSPKNLGSVEMTDGEWVWTQEFIHYVDHHHIAIPEQFLMYLEGNFYKSLENENLNRIRALVADPQALEIEIKYSDDLWSSWIVKNDFELLESFELKADAAPQQNFNIPDDW